MLLYFHPCLAPSILGPPPSSILSPHTPAPPEPVSVPHTPAPPEPVSVPHVPTPPEPMSVPHVSAPVSTHPHINSGLGLEDKKSKSAAHIEGRKDSTDFEYQERT
ncbi:hypothetical protein FCV25MIE_15827 [Fagus crenata]